MPVAPPVTPGEGRAEGVALRLADRGQQPRGRREAIGAPWGVAWVAACLGKRDSGAEPSQTTWWASDGTWSEPWGSARPSAAATPDSPAAASSSAHAPQDSRLGPGDGALAGLLGTTSPVLGSTCPTSLRLP